MGIKLSDVPPQDEAILGTESQRLRGAFLALFGGLLSILRRAVFPHMLAAFGLFMLSAWALSKTGLGLPTPLSWLFVFPLLGLYGVLLFVYGVLVSVVFSVHAVAAHVEDFLYELFASVKDKVRAQIDTLDEGIAKQQAKVILDNSVREAFAPLRSLRMGRTPAVVAGVFLSLLTLVTRSVFLARLARFSATTVHFSKIFASRATLIGALFLNLRWLSALLLWLLYALGAGAVIINLWLIW